MEQGVRPEAAGEQQLAGEEKDACTRQESGESLETFAASFRRLFGLKAPDIRTYSALTLAYIGDAVYELVVRSYITCRANAPVEKLHHRTSHLVNAHTQSELAGAIEEKLTEQERHIYKRGRNAKSFTKAKNATVSDYRRATGLEALIGYLFLNEEYGRLVKLIHDGLESLGCL